MTYEDQVKVNRLVALITVIFQGVPQEKLTDMNTEMTLVVVPIILQFVLEEKHGEMYGALWEAIVPIATKFIPKDSGVYVPEVKP